MVAGPGWPDPSSAARAADLAAGRPVGLGLGEGDGLFRLVRPCGRGGTCSGAARQVVGGTTGWELDPAPPAQPAACLARTTVNGALKRYIRDPSAPPLIWRGGHEIADALAGVKAILG
jgi:hypothetical protein